MTQMSIWGLLVKKKVYDIASVQTWLFDFYLSFQL